MPHRSRPPLLHLVRGGQPGPDAVSTSRGPIQLEMMALLGPRPSVLIVAIDGIDYAQFKRVLIGAGVRSIVDLRLSPSFYGRGFRRELVEPLLRQNGVVYAWLPDLLTRLKDRLGGQQAEDGTWPSFSGEEMDQLRAIREMIDQGPVMVIDRDAVQSRLVLDAFLRGLTGVRPGFSIAILGSPSPFPCPIPQ